MILRRTRYLAGLIALSGCATTAPRDAPASVEVIERVRLRFCPAVEKPEADWPQVNDERGRPLYVGPPSDLTENDVLGSVAMHGANQSVLRITLTNVGAARLAQLTHDNVGRRLAIFIDDRLVSSPRVVEELGGNEAVISGDFSRSEAEEIARALTRNAAAARAAIRQADASRRQAQRPPDEPSSP